MKRNTDRYMGTRPRMAVGPVIVRVLLCRSIVCSYAQRSEIWEEFPGVAEAKSVITTQVKIERCQILTVVLFFLIVLVTR